jgi:hypothetical protein
MQWLPPNNWPCPQSGFGAMGARSKSRPASWFRVTSTTLKLVGSGLLDLIEDNRLGLLPQILPLNLIKHHLNRYPVPGRVHQ